MGKIDEVVVTPWFPRYSKTRHVLRILDGVPELQLKQMMDDINSQRGTPQDPVDWSDPDKWVKERLSGECAVLALRIWNESKHTVNPRHILGINRLMKTYNLIQIDSKGYCSLSRRGELFLDEDQATISEIDRSEGIPKLLVILSSKTRARRGDLLPEWKEFLLAKTKYRTRSSIVSALRFRLKNLIDRELITHEGSYYSITERGMSYLDGCIDEAPIMTLHGSIKMYNDEVREALKTRLSTMHWHDFEKLVGDLLEAMGYDDVEVTKQSGDLGIDVIAKASFGITSFTEIVQVKRKSRVPRSDIDKLKGVLPYHNAIKGTIITTGKFAGGCKKVADIRPPITLIDGDALLNLLTEYGLGVKKTPVEIMEIDDEFFNQTDDTKNNPD